MLFVIVANFKLRSSRGGNLNVAYVAYRMKIIIIIYSVYGYDRITDGNELNCGCMPAPGRGRGRWRRRQHGLIGKAYRLYDALRGLIYFICERTTIDNGAYDGSLA